MKYISREDKSLQLPFSLTCQYKPRGSDSYDFLCTFKMTKLIDMATDEYYFPLIQKVDIKFHFPIEITDASLVSTFPNFQHTTSSTPLNEALGDQHGLFSYDEESCQG